MRGSPILTLSAFVVSIAAFAEETFVEVRKKCVGRKRYTDGVGVEERRNRSQRWQRTVVAVMSSVRDIEGKEAFAVAANGGRLDAAIPEI